MPYQPVLTKAPTQLITTQGQVPNALFDQAVSQLNFADFVLTDVMDKPVGALTRHFAFKQFQFVGISGPDWWLGIAIADVRYVSSGFAYFIRHGEPAIELTLLRPFGWQTQMATSASDGVARIGHNQCNWQFDCLPEHWHIRLHSNSLQADLRLAIAQQAPLALCAPTAYQGCTYTEKNNALAVSGTLLVNGQPVRLDNARGGYDFSAGFMRRETAWRWASINTLLDGVPFGLNLAAGVNETGLCENALWYQGNRQHLSPARFRFSRANQDTRASKEWHISSSCGELDLCFTPGFCRQEKLQLGVLASNFRQYTGFFSGNIQLHDGRTLTLVQCPGWTEDHYAKW